MSSANLKCFGNLANFFTASPCSTIPGASFQSTQIFFSSRVSFFHFRPTAFSPQSDLSFSRSFASKPEKGKKKIGKNSRRLILFRIDIFTFRSKLRRSLSDIFILLDTSKQENFTRALGGFAVKHIHQSRSVSLCHEFSISLSDSGGLKSLSNPAAKFKETICARTNILRTYQTLEGVYVLFIIQI